MQILEGNADIFRTAADDKFDGFEFIVCQTVERDDIAVLGILLGTDVLENQFCGRFLRGDDVFESHAVRNGQER